MLRVDWFLASCIFNEKCWKLREHNFNALPFGLRQGYFYFA